MEQLTDQYQDILPPGLYLALGNHSDQYTESLLSAREADEYRRMQHAGRKDEFVSARGMIRRLADDIGMDGNAVEVHKDGLGKPFGIYEDRRYYLSLAHTGETVLCAISSDIPIGIDLEPAGRPVDERLRDRILHPKERKALKNVELIKIWTLKEALVKLEGTGLRNNLNEIVIRPQGKHAFNARLSDEKTARICSFQHGGYWISVAFFQ